MRKIVVANWVEKEVLDYLRAYGTVEANTTFEPWSAAELIRRCQGATALLSFMTESVDEAFLSACPDLRMVSCALKGYDNYDVAACRRRGVALSIVPDLLIGPTAELTVGLMIALGRKILSADRYIRSGAFAGWRPTFYGTGLAGSTVGLIGMGALGQAVAARLAGFDCSLIYFSQNRLTAEQETRLGARKVGLDELLSRSDYVTAVLPLTPETVHLLDAAAIARMKRGALLINTGRGSVVDEEAVADALASGHLGGYAADVFAMEDWALPDHPPAIPPRLLGADNRTILTSHIGSAVTKVRLEIAMEAARNIVDFLEGRALQGALAAN
ncbi:phosphonate dehydrogenase [Methyloferula stellata]|uniref:phosphonate dehydrogenase n=1 Tax=Methyloferula stellata TaxID=876270 RepID=UPI0003673C3E|nr:phosphonate dehydrogenase [Methyloferula stellata]